MYSCRNNASAIFLRSSARNSASIHEHSSAVALIRCHCSPPPVHSVQKNPRLPLGVLISHRSPFPTASVGRIARYRSSPTRATIELRMLIGLKRAGLIVLLRHSALVNESHSNTHRLLRFSYLRSSAFICGQCIPKSSSARNPEKPHQSTPVKTPS